MTNQFQPGPPAAPMWVDPRPLDSDWDPPKWHDRFRSGTKVAAILTALAMLAAFTWLAGGFRPESTVTAVDWRTPAVTGPVEISILRAIYEPGSEYSAPRVTIEALCRLVVDSATRVQSSDVRNGVAMSFDGLVIARAERYVKFGPSPSSATPRTELSPGVGPTPCIIKGDLPPNQAPVAFVQVMVLNQKWANQGFASAGAEQWVVVRGGVSMKVPVTVLAED